MAVIQEEKTGAIQTFYDVDSGMIVEDGTNATRDFYHPGVQTEYVIGDLVSYILMTLPNGRTITRDINKKPH